MNLAKTRITLTKKNDGGGDTNKTPKPSKVAFVVYWTSLLILLKKCLFMTCLSPPTISNFVFKGSKLIIKMKCQENHETIWKSNCKHYSVGNLISAASVLSSGNTYQRLACFFDLTGLQWITKTSYAIQNRFLLGIVNRDYIKKSCTILEEMKKSNAIHLS